jgi:hypothetical protein
LTLPAEIRNQIYEYVLGGVEVMPRMNTGTRAIQCVSYGLKLRGRKSWEQHIALTFVCRAIHNDTRLLPYSLNIIKLGYCSEAFNKWLSFIGEARTAAIKTVYVRSEQRFIENRELFPVLHRLEGLKRLVYYSESSAGKSLLLHAYVCARKLEMWVDNRIYSVEEMLWDEHDWSEYYAAE